MVERSKGRIFQIKFFLNVKKKSKNNVSYLLGLIFILQMYMILIHAMQ